MIMKKLIIAFIMAFLMPFLSFADERENFKIAINDVAMTYRKSQNFIPLKYIQDSTFITLRLLSSFGDGPHPMTAKLYYPKDNSTRSRGYIYEDDELLSTLELIWQDATSGKLKSIKPLDKYNSYFYTIEDIGTAHVINSKFSQEKPVPTLVYYENGRITRITLTTKQVSNNKPMEEYYYNFLEDGKTLALKWVRYKDGKQDAKNTVTKEETYFIDGNKITTESKDKYAEYNYDDRDLLISMKFKDTSRNFEYSKAIEYNEDKKMTLFIHDSNAYKEETSYEYIDGNLFREIRKRIEKNDSERSNIKIFVSFDKSDTTGVENAWECKHGIYTFTIDGELIEEVDLNKSLTRIKKDGVWTDWVPYRVRM